MTQSVIDPPALRRPSWGVRLLVAVLLLAGVAWLIRYFTTPVQLASSDLETIISPAFLPESEVDRLIAAYEGRIQDHTDALDYRTLGFLYLEKGRLSGDPARYQAAHTALLRARDLFPTDPTTRIGLASALYSLHDFSPAKEEASFVFEQTGQAGALAVRADANLALGSYEEGAADLERLGEEVGELPAVLVREAEWGRVRGDADQAWERAQAAAELTSTSPNGRLRAWYQAFAAQMAWYLGRYEEGRALVDQALEADPTSREGMIVSARLLASDGQLEEAIGRYEQVTVVYPDPGLLSELAALYRFAGNEAAAAETSELLGVVATLAESQGVYDRSLALHLAAIDPPQAVEIARHDLERRQDVGAWDALSWALFHDGDLEGARAASREALSLDTLDARLWFHGGIIALAAGETTEAESFLEKALQLSPQFFPADAQEASEALHGLG
ncbi:MAG TPA: tetratricopeptide repeat protein [Acidimicrobiia bacterium]|nr:tetratricopeptide repeat protein [Acidimicrobiia bacterium]